MNGTFLYDQDWGRCYSQRLFFCGFAFGNYV
jgi:hypothetical protein